ncbi:hypothetical protein Rfer_4393 (plasmid) [Rhodoferax ferrireducens T118]|uniref:Type 4 fimbrial biogenesis protein PilX N-terminal domain-containing protein n=2 Tax=Rhodoferax ferrireducens TaxID=192843 RepID=Q21Q66_ALBFT|nr:hypothetical protein Rfer_4393 [Rhodoferax ferrireducens T118]
MMPRRRLTSALDGKQKGFMLAYVMLMIAVVSIAMSGIAFMNKGMASKSYMDDAKNVIQSQVGTIRGQILLCGLLYPSGNNATTFNIKYPGGSAVNVSALTCPGSPAANKSLWTGGNGTFLSPVPSGFTGWVYTNDAAGIKVVLTSNGGVLENNVLTSVAAKFTSVEANIVGNVMTIWIVKS